ncbi:hypothetical protein SAMN05444156_2992 [Verrucomicrobium sp. GAS474]|uniref:carboxypeptidase regulatory-like domain-containing protein n=1 Tax=Verrucomicrobium sp. GAS474 TaxID=1882831 RepID=UPI00087BEF7E|nr:carboxypeptidase regulatory-like domain-containing protein [Verrucomicrobium sp. GAS474]SDU27336.1 hypothetical protein SAMN05444156_2992 [Verrucomicrobium sp. GAS474]
MSGSQPDFPRPSGSPTRQLPPRPNLDFYRNEAKSLLKAHATGAPEALARFVSLRGAKEEPPALNDAQWVIAREHGFKNWAEFKEAVLSRTRTEGGMLFRVVDPETGEPIVGAVLSIEASPAAKNQLKTGADGTAVVPPLASGSQYLSIRVVHSERVPRLVSWSWNRQTARLPETFVLTMERRRTIGGVVRNRRGEPVGHARVVLILRGSSGDREGAQVFNDLWEREAVTDAEGRWTFSEAPSDLIRMSVAVAHPEYVRERIDPLPPAEAFRAREAVLIVRDGSVCEGTVIDAAGVPLNGVEVFFGEAGSDSVTRPSTITDVAGRFRFGALSLEGGRDRPILTFIAPGYAPELIELFIDVPSVPLRVVLSEGTPIRGRIVDAEGKPVAGVHLGPHSWRGHRSLRNWFADSDENGEFVWEHGPDDSVWCLLVHEDFEVQMGELRVQADPLVFRMRRPLRVEGSVVDARTGLPIPIFTLLAGKEFGGQTVPFWNDPRLRRPVEYREGRYLHHFGRYDFLSVGHGGGPGEEPFQRIRIEANGYLPSVSRRIARGEGNVVIDFPLSPIADVSGTVVSPEGKPVEGARLTVVGTGGVATIRAGRVIQEDEHWTVETDEKGSYDFPAQEANFPVVVLHPDIGYLVTTSEEVLGTSVLRLQAWAGVRVKTSPLPVGSHISLFFPDEKGPTALPAILLEKQATAEEGGLFFGHLRAGLAQMAVAGLAWGHMPFIEVVEGSVTEIDLRGRGEGSICGRLTLPGDMSRFEPLAIQGRLMPCFSGAAFTGAFEIDPDGVFHVDGVAPGKYRLVIHFRSPRPATAEGMPVYIATTEFTLGEETKRLDLGTMQPELKIATVSKPPIP